ncbi:MAG: site-specific integrase, partial [bacterium]
MFTAFKQYLLSLKLSPVSRKLYLSDIRRFLANFSSEPTLDQLSSSTSYLAYLDLLRSQAIAPSMLKRTIASLRQFGSFFALTYSLPNPMINLHQASLQSSNEASTLNLDYIKHFTNYLNTEHLSPLTIKSYKSDITRYLDWVSTHTASNKMDEVLNDKNIKLYLNHLSESGATLPSTIERKEKSIARMSTWYAKVYPATSITDNNTNAPRRGEVISPAIFDIQTPSTLSSVLDHSQLSPDLTSNFVKTFNYRTALAFVVLTIFASALAIFGYRQFSSDAKLIAAYPNTPVTPNRQLSFQGRLENASGTPITTATNLTFKLFNAVSGPTELYSTGACSITPDADGVFSTQIGSTCGTGIPATVFTENSNIWLEVTVVAEILTPRQAIASVAYALNSETIQGFPISSTVSAIRNTVVPMNQWGEIVVGEQSPRLTGVSGTFQISAPSISITTATGTNGNITIAPDGTGQVNVNGNTTSTNFFNV